MKLLFFALLSFGIVSCKESTKNTNTFNKSLSQEKLRLLEVISFNGIKNTSLIVNDSIILLIPDNSISPQYYSARTIFFDSVRQKFIFRNSPTLKPYANMKSDLNVFHKRFKNLGELRNPSIQYSQLPDQFKQDSSLRVVLNTNLLVHEYLGNYYLVSSVSPKSVYMLESTTKKIKRLDLPTDYFKVLGFFACDLDNDNRPELFFISVGERSGEDTISYSLYSIRDRPLEMKFE